MLANQSTRLTNDIESIEFLYDQSTHEVLKQAADQFIKTDGSVTEIWAASRDWFLEEWGRDTFIALPGLLLTTRRYDAARAVFRHFASLEKHGLIPNVIQTEKTLYNTSDASLWFLHALKLFSEATNDTAFDQELMPTVKNILMNYKNGTVYDRHNQPQEIVMDPADGLIISPAQSTWMDADPSNQGTNNITPRNGKCVEINALWYEALNFYVDLLGRLGLPDDVAASDIINELKKTFVEQFWNQQTGYFNDVIMGDQNGQALRPNQIIALSYAAELISQELREQAMAAITAKLLTPGGLRSLSPDDPAYIGHYDTFQPIYIKDRAYHQGTIWPWLIGPYCDALADLRTQQNLTKQDIGIEIGHLIAPLVKFCLDSEYQSLPEVFSGDPPFEPGGTTSQAWSVSEVLRLLDLWMT